MKRWIKSFLILSVICLSGVCVRAEELNFDTFKGELSLALDERYNMAQNLVFDASESKKNAVDVATKEWESLKKYDMVSFKSGDEETNEEYLRKVYLAGLKEQKDLNPQLGNDEFWEKWDEGYLSRANVLEELFHVESWTINPEKDDLIRAELDKVTGGFVSNGTLEAYQVQMLTGAYADGKPGKGTVLKLKEKQEALGLPINGVVNQQRIEELVEAMESQGLHQEIEKVNTELTNKEQEIRWGIESAGFTVPESGILLPMIQKSTEEESETDTEQENTETEMQSEEETMMETEAM